MIIGEHTLIEADDKEFNYWDKIINEPAFTVYLNTIDFLLLFPGLEEPIEFGEGVEGICINRRAMFKLDKNLPHGGYRIDPEFTGAGFLG